MIEFSDGRIMKVWDGGPDGVAQTADNTLFAAGGLFLPSEYRAGRDHRRRDSHPAPRISDCAIRCDRARP
jgi:hypothetical protein